MTKPIAIVAILAATAAVTGCQSVQRSIGTMRVAPDEFRVVTRAPLSLPPEYALRPPRPGEPRPQEQDPAQEARATLFGQDIGVQASQGERALVNAAGAQNVDEGIRDQIDYEAQGIVRRNQGFVDRVLSFGGADAPPAAPLDAAAEQRRLEEEEANRRVTGGGPVTIRREGGGFKLPGT